jgi:hypothetical protein
MHECLGEQRPTGSYSPRPPGGKGGWGEGEPLRALPQEVEREVLAPPLPYKREREIWGTPRGPPVWGCRPLHPRLTARCFGEKEKGSPDAPCPKRLSGRSVPHPSPTKEKGKSGGHPQAPGKGFGLCTPLRARAALERRARMHDCSANSVHQSHSLAREAGLGVTTSPVPRGEPRPYVCPDLHAIGVDLWPNRNLRSSASISGQVRGR